MKNYFGLTTAFFLVAGPLAPSAFAEERIMQKIRNSIIVRTTKVNTSYQSESLNQQIESLHKEQETLAEKGKENSRSES